jgi:hypothetical protein
MREGHAAILQEIYEHWGEGVLADQLFGAAADIPGVRAMFGRYQRLSASPTMATPHRRSVRCRPNRIIQLSVLVARD